MPDSCASCSQASSFSIEPPINKPRNRIANWRMMVNSADSIFSASTLAICWGVIWPRGFTQSAAAVSGEILRLVVGSSVGDGAEAGGGPETGTGIFAAWRHDGGPAFLSVGGMATSLHGARSLAK